MMETNPRSEASDQSLCATGNLALSGAHQGRGTPILTERKDPHISGLVIAPRVPESVFLEEGRQLGRE